MTGEERHRTEYTEIEAILEADGRGITPEEYAALVEYAHRKAASAGEDESYVTLLLPDVIREYLFRKELNSVHKKED